MQGVLTAVLKDRAGQAHGLGCAVAAASGWSSFSLWVKENVRILTPARAVELPLPQICNWTG
jgi:hypothetical protein